MLLYNILLYNIFLVTTVLLFISSAYTFWFLCIKKDTSSENNLLDAKPQKDSSSKIYHI